MAVLLRKELSEQWRTMRVAGATGVFLFIGISSPLFAKYAPDIIRAVAGPQLGAIVPPPQLADAVAQFVKNVGQIGALLAIVLAMGGVPAEKDRGTAAFVLSKPVGRARFLGAKLLALAITLAGAVLAAGVATYFYTAVLFSTLGPGFIVTCAASLLALVVFATLTFAVSTVTGSTAVAAAGGLAALLAGGALSVIPRAGDYFPAGMLGRAQQIALGAPAGAILLPAAAEALFVVALFALTAAAFRRQQL